MMFLFSGCAQIERDKKSMSLEAAVNAYGSAMRWGYFETASGYLHADAHAQVPRPDWTTNLRILSYEVVQPAVLGSDEVANQVVKIDYLYEDEQRVRSLVDRQIWRYDAGSGTWWLYSGLPPFK